MDDRAQLNATRARSAEQLCADGLRVALFSGNYNYVREGANQALNKLVGHLLERGAAVRIYSPTTATPAFEPVGELVAVLSFTLPKRREFRVAPGLPGNLQEDVRAFAPNVVHVSTPDWLDSAAQRLARRLHVPVVASMHTHFETYFDYYGLGLLKSWAIRRQRSFYRASDRVLVPNRACQRHLESLGVPGNSMRIWSRGVDPERFSPEFRDEEWRRSLGYRDDEPVLLFFGRLVREKGIACFVATVAELRRRGLSVRPLIVGDGPARGEVAEVGDAVFTGELHGTALSRAVASADILLNPSMTETFGNVSLEAMAAGLTVVCADAESSRGLIRDGHNGYICPADPVAFADVIQSLWADRSLRETIGANALRTADEYRWPDVLDAVIEAYRELVPAR